MTTSRRRFRELRQSVSMTEPATGTATSNFKLKLSAPPTSPVTVSTAVQGVTPAPVDMQSWTDPDISTTTSVTLDSNNWNTGEDVTITLSTDDDAENDVARITYTVTQAGGLKEYNGHLIGSTTVNISDPETGVVEFKESSETSWAEEPDLEMDDGGTLDLDVRLSHRPRGQRYGIGELPNWFGPFSDYVAKHFHRQRLVVVADVEFRDFAYQR